MPSSTYSRWGIKSLGCGGSTTSRVPEYVVDHPGDSGLGRAKNTSWGLLPQVFLQVEHGDLHAGEDSEAWWAVVV